MGLAAHAPACPCLYGRCVTLAVMIRRNLIDFLIWQAVKAIARGVLFGFIMVWIVGWPAVFVMLAVEQTSIDEYEYWWLILIIGVYGIVLQLIITPFISYLALASPPDDELPAYEELVSPGDDVKQKKSKQSEIRDPALAQRLMDNQL